MTLCNLMYTTISYLSVQQSKLSPRGAVDDPMTLLHEAEGNSPLGHPQHRGCDSFDCRTERYEIIVLLPNLQRVIISAKLMRVLFVYNGRPWRERLFKLPVTSLFLARNIKCGC